MKAHDRGPRPTVPSVLVVEPYADLRDGIVSTLRRSNYVCDAVATPGDAALMLRDHDYAYVVIDIDVPEATGEFVSSISEESNVLLITDGESRATAGHDTLRKPFSRDELLAHLVQRRG